MDQGNLYVVAAPSGTGKTTLVKALIESMPGITVSISHTTRPRRPAEIEATDYYFIDEKKFKSMIDSNEFLEHARVFDNFYGTSRTWVEQTLAKGIDVILEIDWQGAQQIQHLFSESINIFILPPSSIELYQRLLNRKQDSPDIIKQRIADVKEAVSHIHEFDYVVLNDTFEHALNDLKIIIHAGRLIQKRQTAKYAKLIKDLERGLDVEK